MNTKEIPKWVQDAAQEITGRFGHTFPETKDALETLNLAVPIANIINNHRPINRISYSD